MFMLVLMLYVMINGHVSFFFIFAGFNETEYKKHIVQR